MRYEPDFELTVACDQARLTALRRMTTAGRRAVGDAVAELFERRYTDTDELLVAALEDALRGLNRAAVLLAAAVTGLDVEAEQSVVDLDDKEPDAPHD